MESSQFRTRITRNYLKVQELFAKVGGLFNAFLIALQVLLYNYTRFKFNSNIFDSTWMRLYSQDPEQAKLLLLKDNNNPEDHNNLEQKDSNLNLIPYISKDPISTNIKPYKNKTVQRPSLLNLDLANQVVSNNNDINRNSNSHCIQINNSNANLTSTIKKTEEAAQSQGKQNHKQAISNQPRYTYSKSNKEINDNKEFRLSKELLFDNTQNPQVKEGDNESPQQIQSNKQSPFGSPHKCNIEKACQDRNENILKNEEDLAEHPESKSNSLQQMKKQKGPFTLTPNIRESNLILEENHNEGFLQRSVHESLRCDNVSPCYEKKPAEEEVVKNSSIFIVNKDKKSTHAKSSCQDNDQEMNSENKQIITDKQVFLQKSFKKGKTVHKTSQFNNLSNMLRKTSTIKKKIPSNNILGFEGGEEETKKYDLSGNELDAILTHFSNLKSYFYYLLSFTCCAKYQRKEYNFIFTYARRNISFNHYVHDSFQSQIQEMFEEN